ncbi:MAG: fasciclin domain-containing protein [Anaerolineaceae bacterium]|nr:fasciclin domain-containing protein [Anaerolineaceae bacterium]
MTTGNILCYREGNYHGLSIKGVNMFKKSLFLLLISLFIVTFVQAQGETPARMRIMQLSYLPPSNTMIEIQLNEVPLFGDISFPFTTDYVEVSTGEHTLTTTIVDQAEASASTPLILESGHKYSIIVDGDYSQQVAFIVVDETNLRSDVRGSTAVIVNLTGQTIENVTINDEQTLDSVQANNFGFLTLPETEFIISGMISNMAYSETFTPHANTDFLIAVRLMPTGEPQVIYQRSSQSTITEYLRSIHEGAQFAQVAELIAQTDLLDSLADNSEYTLFLPVNAVFDGQTIKTDSLHDLLFQHTVAQNLPPYVLPENELLTTITGSSLSLNFGSTDSGYWEIEGVPILWDVRLANGVIYGIDGVINPAQ